MNIADTSILIIATSGFEQSELEVPRDRLKAMGATVTIASPKSGSITGWQGTDWGHPVEVDIPLEQVNTEEYHALVLPGGQINPDLLRVNKRVIQIIHEFNNAGKPIAAICHAPWLLIEADILKGVRATSYQSIVTDMKNAGAQWEDKKVIREHNIITSRQPDDLGDFVDAIKQALEQSDRRAQQAEAV